MECGYSQEKTMVSCLGGVDQMNGGRDYIYHSQSDLAVS
jgi:hypothetical protein